MIFALPTFPTALPVPSLRGNNFRPKPILPRTVIGPAGQEMRQVLVDSGADDVVFPADMAIRLGVDLSAFPSGAAHGVGGSSPLAILYAAVILYLTDGTDSCRWRAVVGFTHGKLRLPLFGIAGGLEYFRTTLDVVDREIILIPKPTLPVTQDAAP